MKFIYCYWDQRSHRKHLAMMKASGPSGKLEPGWALSFCTFYWTFGLGMHIIYYHIDNHKSNYYIHCVIEQLDGESTKVKKILRPKVAHMSTWHDARLARDACHDFTENKSLWNPFSPRLDPSYPSRRSHLPAQRFDKRGCKPMKLIEGKYFHQNSNTFYTKHFYLPTFVPTCYFPLYRDEATIIFGKMWNNLFDILKSLYFFPFGCEVIILPFMFDILLIFASSIKETYYQEIGWLCRDRRLDLC